MKEIQPEMDSDHVTELFIEAINETKSMNQDEIGVNDLCTVLLNDRMHKKAEVAFNGNKEDIFTKEFYQLVKENS